MTDQHEEIANNLLDEIENAEPFEPDEVESDKDQSQPCGLITMKDAILEFYHELDKPPVQQIKTGFSSLDGLVDGFRPGQMIVMAARPGQGKTALATNIITNMLDVGIPALFFSLEMSRLEIMQRLFSSVGQIPLREIRSQDRTQQTLDAIAETGNILSGWPLVMCDSPRLRVADIETLSRDGISSHGVGCIIIDYLGLIEPDKPSQPRYEQVTAISREIKTMARTLDVPVIVLAQLNRESSSNKDNRPKISHLRDSGAIEQDADIVLLIHRPSEYDNQADKSKAEIIVAKNRNGTTGHIDLFWEGEYTRFVNPPEIAIESEQSPEPSETPLYEDWKPGGTDGKQETEGDGFDFQE